jgi:hypothetical protein
MSTRKKGEKKLIDLNSYLQPQFLDNSLYIKEKATFQALQVQQMP